MKELKEKRAGLIYEMKDLVEQGKKNADGKMSAEQEERWGKLDAEQDGILKEVGVLERQETLNREMAAKEAAKIEPKADNKEEREAKKLEAFRNYIKTGDVKEYRATQDGQSVGTDADGGYTVPETWATNIENATLAFGGMLDVSTVITTSSGDQINYPTTNDTTTRSAIVTEETISTTSKKTFATLQLNAYTLRTNIIPISIELLQDSAYNMEMVIANILAENDARGLNYYCTVGTGLGEHNGVVTASTLGQNAAATALTVDNLLDLKHSVDPSYRKGARWMFNDETLKYIKKLSVGSTDDRPLWQPSFIVGEPDTIDGDLYTINQDMADIGATYKSILYGDFKKYLIRRVGGYSLFRFNETYMTSLQIGLMGFSRSDGELLNAGTNPIKHILHAST